MGDSYFDTHTVDSKQPWTNGISGIFNFCVLFLWYERKTQTVNSKRSSGELFLGYVFRIPTCLDISQDN